MAQQSLSRSPGAILAADIVGYSRQMGRDEEATLRVLRAYRGLIADHVGRYGGRVFGVAGDSEMAVLPGAPEALSCALEIQDAIGTRNAELPQDRRMPLRIGLHLGLVLADAEGVYGDDVNIAARVEATARGGGICLSGEIFDQLDGELPCGFEDYGPQRFRNIARRVRVYRVRREVGMRGRVVPGKLPKPRSRWRWAAAAALLLAVGLGVWGWGVRQEMAEAELAAAARLAALNTRLEQLAATLDEAKDGAAARRSETAQLLAALQDANESREAGQAHRAAEAQRMEDLLAALQAAETRAGVTQRRAETELAAQKQAAEQARAEAALAAWRLAEREAAAQRQGVEEVLLALSAAERNARAEAGAAEARAAERAQVQTLLASLRSAEARAGAQLRDAEEILAALGETAGTAGQQRAQALIAALTQAGQAAAGERKRAELLLATWQAAEPDGSKQAVEETAAERARAEALLATLKAAEENAAAQRARAEATLSAAKTRALLQSLTPPRRKPVSPLREPAATDAASPAPADRAPAQLAALPPEPEAIGAALSEPEAEATPENEQLSLAAVERLLRSREEDLRNRLQAYIDAHPEEFDWSLPRVKRIWDIEALSRENENYEVRVILERPPVYTDDKFRNAPSAETLIIFTKLDGADFEIVGHRWLFALR